MNNHGPAIILLIVAIAVFFAYVNPTWTGKIASIKSAIAMDDKTLASVSAYTQQESQLTSERNAIDPSSLAKLASFLPDSVDNVGIILDLNALAARSGLSLSNIDVMTNAKASTNGSLPAAGESPTNSVDLSLSAVGTYSAFQAFLSGIEKSQRLLDVHNLVINGSDTGVYRYQMTLRLYWLQ